MARLYCFEIGHDTPVTLPAPTAGDLVFVSSEVWAPDGGGLSDADATCQGDAAAAGKTGTFLAALSPDSRTTAGRFTSGG
jgi:hypothetical protein